MVRGAGCEGWSGSVLVEVSSGRGCVRGSVGIGGERRGEVKVEIMDSGHVLVGNGGNSRASNGSYIFWIGSQDAKSISRTRVV